MIDLVISCLLLAAALWVFIVFILLTLDELL